MIERHRTKHLVGGFSLLEVLVAFAVFSLSLGVLFQIFSSGLRGTDVARSYSRAMMIAESQLNLISVAEELVPGVRQGVVEGGYDWNATVSRYDDGAPTEETTGALQAYHVSVRVNWGEGEGREVALDTLRLGRGAE